MASKTIEADNDRRLTIMTATFIPCGAKLPVIALMGGIMTAYATGDYVAAGFITPLMYFIGVVAVLVSAIILKKTKPFSGKPAPFVMELPQYHIPSVKTVLLHVWERLKRLHHQSRYHSFPCNRYHVDPFQHRKYRKRNRIC